MGHSRRHFLRREEFCRRGRQTCTTRIPRDENPGLRLYRDCLLKISLRNQWWWQTIYADWPRHRDVRPTSGQMVEYWLAPRLLDARTFCGCRVAAVREIIFRESQIIPRGACIQRKTPP